MRKKRYTKKLYIKLASTKILIPHLKKIEGVKNGK